MRCDMNLFIANQEFIETGIIPKAFERCTFDKNAKVTLTTRIRDNKKNNDNFIPGGVKTGCSVICCNNDDRKSGVFNGMIFNVVDVDGLIKIERGKVIEDYFKFKEIF